MKLDIILHEIEGEGYLCIKLADLTILKRKRKIFTPPTIEQVKEYCKERNNNVNADHWLNFYEAKGWMIGKNKMKDWKAAVRTWESNSFTTVVDNHGEIHRGTNLGEPPPEMFGVPSKTAITYEEYLKNKKS